jgi:hypothetical protein
MLDGFGIVTNLYRKAWAAAGRQEVDGGPAPPVYQDYRAASGRRDRKSLNRSNSSRASSTRALLI